MLLCAIFMAVGFTSCSDDDDDEGSIVGTWLYMVQEDEDQWYCQLDFKSDGSLHSKSWYFSDETDSREYTFKWSVTADILTLTGTENGETIKEAYRFKLDGNQLIIYDFDEDGPNVFVRK